MAGQGVKVQKGDNISAVAGWLWRLFSSMRLAVVLMLLIAGLSLLGALLIQVPSAMAGDPQLYYYWVETVASSKVGGWAPFLSALRLFDVFHSPWFAGAGGLLMLNILICSVNRWKGIRLGLRGGIVRHRENFYTDGNTCADLSIVPVPSVQAARISENVLRARGFRIRTESDENNVYIAADKNNYFRLGTYFSHLSLIIFILAFLAGSYFGFRDSRFTVAVGSSREIGHSTDLSLQLTSFVDEYYDSGMPKDYRSQVDLYEDGDLVKQSLIRVNHPLVYKGVRVYQAYFGPVVKMLVRDENGQDIYRDSVPLDSSFYVQGFEHYEGFFDLPETGISIRLIRSMVNSDAPIIPAGQLAVDFRQGNEQIDLKLVEPGVPRMVGGLEFTFLGESKYSGFQVSRDPTNMLIWIASILFIIGVCSVLYFPHRQVWILSQSLGQENSRLLIRTSASRYSRSTTELSTLVSQMENELPACKIGEDS